jgi:hypothetical protein
VQLHDDSGTFCNLLLIREFRAGSDTPEYPPLTLEQLQGAWAGSTSTISAD